MGAGPVILHSTKSAIIQKMAAQYGFTLFDTAIGLCGLVWDEDGIAGVQLPEGSQAATRSRLLLRFPKAEFLGPPPELELAISGIRAVIEGEPTDLSEVPLNLAGLTAFDRKVYEAAKSIPFGSTATYGDIAARIGDPGAARAVGRALGRNPYPIIIPCHRVLAAGTKLGGFSAPGGVETKQKLLRAEGIIAGEQPSLF